MTARDRIIASSRGGASERRRGSVRDTGDPEAITWSNIRRAWRAYLLLAPIFALLIVFVYYPPILGFVRAFFKWAPTKEPVFVGLRNFRSYFAFPEASREFINVIKLACFGLVSSVLAPLVMAEMIFAVRSNAGKEIYRYIVVIPMLVPGVVYTLLWQHIYDPNLGPINALLRAVGLGALQNDWLGNPNTALYAIMGVGFPWVAQIGTLICLGGLAQVPDSVFDACLLDGCTGVRRIVTVDLPLILSQIRLLTILSVINAFTSFNSVLILTRGGPGYATSVPALRMFERAFTTGEYGYAAAIGLLLFTLAVGLTVLINRYMRPHFERDS